MHGRLGVHWVDMVLTCACSNWGEFFPSLSLSVPAVCRQGYRNRLQWQGPDTGFKQTDVLIILNVRVQGNSSS